MHFHILFGNSDVMVNTSKSVMFAMGCLEDTEHQLEDRVKCDIEMLLVLYVHMV